MINAGYLEEKSPHRADIIIINTCTVTHTADKKSRQKIRQALRANTHGKVIVTGCAVENESSKIGEISEDLIIVRNIDKEDIVNAVSSLKIDHERAESDSSQEAAQETFEIDNNDDSFSDFSLLDSNELRTRAVIKIQDGCNQFCSYCIVPYVRGSNRSRRIEDIVREIDEIGRNGFKEIVISGIHIGLYGVDLYGRRALPELLKTVIKTVPSVRLRLTSIEPNDFSPELLKIIRENREICPHIHLPLQHINDRILERMNRGYKRFEFEKLMDMIVRNLPDVSITTDIIIGFPGETDSDFSELLEFVKRSNFYRLHVFKFSPRAGTRAYSYKDDVPEDVKSERSSLLIDAGREKTKEFCERFIGRNLKVLIEQKRESFSGGLSENYIRVIIKGVQCEKGMIYKVKITAREDTHLIGELFDTVS